MSRAQLVISGILQTTLRRFPPNEKGGNDRMAKDNRLFMETNFWCVRNVTCWRDIPEHLSDDSTAGPAYAGPAATDRVTAGFFEAEVKFGRPVLSDRT